MGNGYEKFTVSEIRDILETEYGITDENILSQTKKPLVKLIVELQGEQDDDKEAEELNYQLEVTEEEDDTIVDDDSELEDDLEEAPHFYSSSWSKYVMSLFDPSELSEGHPTCDGCRRIVNQLIGPIVESGVAEIIPANRDNNGTATVVFQIKVKIHNENHPLYNSAHNSVVHMEDVADCNKGNADFPYNKYLSAMAATRAEGRILRKMLGLQTIIAEETSDDSNEVANDVNDNWQPSNLINPSQETCIDLMCQRHDMNVGEFINSGQGNYKNIGDIPYDIAIAMIKNLNDIQREVIEKPSNISGY